MKKKTALILSLIFIVALGLRIFAYYILGRVENPLFWEYHSIANNFIDGKGLSYYFLGATHFVYAEPFYCLLSSFFYFIIIFLAFSGLYIIAKKITDAECVCLWRIRCYVLFSIGCGSEFVLHRKAP